MRWFWKILSVAILAPPAGLLCAIAFGIFLLDPTLVANENVGLIELLPSQRSIGLLFLSGVGISGIVMLSRRTGRSAWSTGFLILSALSLAYPVATFTFTSVVGVELMDAIVRGEGLADEEIYSVFNSESILAIAQIGFALGLTVSTILATVIAIIPATVFGLIALILRPSKIETVVAFERIEPTFSNQYKNEGPRKQ